MDLHRCSPAIVLALVLGIVRASYAAEPDISTLSAYAGTWRSHIVYHATRESAARTQDVELRNDCWRSAEYYACHQFLAGASASLIVYTRDGLLNRFHSYVISRDGTPSSRGALVIDGNVWTYPWQARELGKTVYYRVLNIFRSARSIEFRQEFSTDGAHWTRMADGAEHRVGG